MEATSQAARGNSGDDTRAKILPGVDREFYRRIATSHPSWREAGRVTIPASHGGAIEVKKGQVLRVLLSEGPQIVDFNCWNLEDPREHFWSGRTRILEGAHLTTFNRIWSTHPWMRPMMTMIADTVEHRPSPGGGAGHDCIYARCNNKIWEIASGQHDHRNCQDNLTEAITPFGLDLFDVHDAFNLFMKTGVDPSDGKLFFERTDGAQGDYVDLYAEMDLLAASSSCPAGDGADGLEDPAVYGLEMIVFDIPKG